MRLGQRFESARRLFRTGLPKRNTQNRKFPVRSEWPIDATPTPIRSAFQNLAVLVVPLRGLEDALGLQAARHLEPHFAPVAPDLDGEVEERAAQALQSDVLRQRDQHLRLRRVPEGVTVFQFPDLVEVLAQPTPQRPIPLALLGVHHREVAGEGRFALVVSRLHVLLLPCPKDGNHQSAYRSSFLLCAARLKATSTILLKVCFKSMYRGVSLWKELLSVRWRGAQTSELPRSATTSR